ncbi:arabinogalactan endo-beta-1,4-galactanase [Lachnospiraceae bacterium C1.1]|nr:glycosyl hydrolase 53 family protein [Lachnospiraceae bacterium C1.1]
MVKGADISWISMLEKLGMKYVDENQQECDPLDLLKGYGINTIRLRLFVDPPGSCFWRKNNGQRVMLGFCDRKGVLETAKRVKDKGFKLMIDFHYSDHFADPEHQDVPKLWSAADEVWAVALIQEHTERFLEALRDQGVSPEYVQVGNEINNGMLFPLGKYPEERGNLAKFLTAGYDAVKTVFPDAKVITHLAEGNNRKFFEKFFDDIIGTYKAKTDIIGMSYYPYWLGKTYKETINDLSVNLLKCASKYGKEVMICEIGGLENEPDETAKMIKLALEAVEVVPDNKGLGVIYWEPAACSKVLPDNYPLGACRMIKENILQFTDAMKGFMDR